MEIPINLMKDSSWKKSGWRSLLHRGYPKAVVRFGQGSPKLKLLMPEDEFNTNEMAQGRVPADTLAAMLKQAQGAWEEKE